MKTFASDASASILSALRAAQVDPFRYTKRGKRVCASRLWSASAKTLKSEESGDADLALVLYFKPGAFCPFMSRGCYAACLGEHAGRMVMQGCQRAQLNRTLYWLADRDGFVRDLAEQAFIKMRWRNRKQGGVAGATRTTVRLNGTSDLQGLRKVRDAIRNRCESSLFGDLVFYEYSKNWSLVDSTEAERGYHLTLSRCETTTDEQVRTAAANGINVAVVFDTKRGKPLPTTYLGLPVIDGDLSDDRTRDPKGVVVGLRAKGRMRKDETGMVVKVAV